MSKPPPRSTRNPAFQSKLEPHREFIRESRAKRWSYPRIAAATGDSWVSTAPAPSFPSSKFAPNGAGSMRFRPRRNRQFSIHPIKLQSAGLLQPARTKGTP